MATITTSDLGPHVCTFVLQVAGQVFLIFGASVCIDEFTFIYNQTRHIVGFKLRNWVIYSLPIAKYMGFGAKILLRSLQALHQHGLLVLFLVLHLSPLDTDFELSQIVVMAPNEVR